MTDPAEDPAKTRFLTLQLARLGGLLVVVTGVVVWRSDTIGAPQPTAGKALFALGLFLMLVVPALLRKHWRSPD